jgi:ectoine hydroxylase-related dioxygenase (phytanoyl-CoA dioxygenase family)
VSEHRSATGAATIATAAMPGAPTVEQLARYRRDGFLVVERFLDDGEVDRVRARWPELFEHRWATGVSPDEVNFDPTSTPADRTRQLCNVWKSDTDIAAVTLSEKVGRWAAALASAPAMRINQDNLIWKPAGGRALLAHQDGSYLGWLDPPNMTTVWMALDDTHADTGTIFYARGSHRWPRTPPDGQFHAPDDWLAHLRASCPPGETIDLVPVEVPAGGAAFHDAWTFHGSPPNERSDRERRAIISHCMRADTRWSPAHTHSIYGRYRKPGDTEFDEAFFPVIWDETGRRSGWLDRFTTPGVHRAERREIA